MYTPQFRIRGKGVPILGNAEIDFHAEAFLRDYNPSLLTNPQPINIEELAEYYLGLTMEYDYLSHNGFIWGRMVFNDTGRIPVYLPDEGRADYIPAKRGTVIIDNTLLDDDNEYRLRSTVGHECGHWVFHSSYYTFDPNQLSLFDMDGMAATACRKQDIEGDVEGRRRLESDQDWLEHHAKYFSAAILMPKTMFVKVVDELETRSKIPKECWAFRDDYLANYLSETFNVSPTSAKIRLKQLGLSVEDKLKHLTDQILRDLDAFQVV